jgi:hypothetical protein
MVVMTCAYVAIGVTLILQPGRYGNTPSYAVLLEIANQGAWGAAYLVIAAGIGASVLSTGRRYGRWLAVTSHTAAIALTGAWLAAFIVRWLTDDGTTIVNIVSWSVYLSLLIRSALQMDDLHPEPRS